MLEKKVNAASANCAADINTAYVPVDSDFILKNNSDEISIDSNFSSQSFWSHINVFILILHI